MKSVLISIQPKWCELIANGKKTVEVRKTRPKLETPFKGYIYCTSSNVHECLFQNENGVKLIHAINYKTAIPCGGHIGNGKVWLSVLSGHTQPPVWLDCTKTVFLPTEKGGVE